MPYTAYNSVSKMGLAASSGAVKEQYIPLWVYSSGASNCGNTSTSAPAFLPKGSNASTVGVAVNKQLHTLNANWNASQKFVLEASVYSAGGSATANVALWDMTTNAVVAGSTISTTATTATVLRSSAFTLTAGHSYGVALWTSNASYGCIISKAHLVAIN